MAVNEGQVAAAARRDSPWWTRPGWANEDPELRAMVASGIDYDPTPLADLEPGGLYLLYGPRRVGKTSSVKRSIQRLLEEGTNPLRIIRVTVDGWQANRLGTLYESVVRVLTSSVEGESRYWFIDEITGCHGDWWSVIKSLRDNTSFRDDCVVLTGSSNSNLDEAIKAFAGRRGPVADPDRALLPMDFRSFCHSLSVDVPNVGGVRPDELMSDHARDTWLGLALYTDNLAAAWHAYLQVGGYPKAVADWRRSNTIETPTWQALWDVVRGEAVTRGTSEATVAAIFGGIAERLASQTEVSGFARDAGVTRETLNGRLAALRQAFLVWSCPRADDNGHPDWGKQKKLYFFDPLLARLPELAHGQNPVDITRLNEQQLGVTLLQWNERVRPGSIRSEDWVTHYRGDRGEVDFAGTCADNLARSTPLEGKYVSGSWRQEALGIRNTPLKGGVLATRDILEVPPGEAVWAVPAPFIAFAISSDVRR